MIRDDELNIVLTGTRVWLCAGVQILLNVEVLSVDLSGGTPNYPKLMIQLLPLVQVTSNTTQRQVMLARRIKVEEADRVAEQELIDDDFDLKLRQERIRHRKEIEGK